ncbi:MAG: PorT family protein [Prevotellaceae bacterium]|jgi:hypothetical protein|nr:PorT family protein [Prevotellaceae bacterium]
MKKIITTFYFACAVAGMVAAQPSIRIGSIEINFRKNSDTTALSDEQQRSLKNGGADKEQQPSSKDGGAGKKQQPYRRHSRSSFIGVGFIVPNNNSSDSRYYTALGANSYNIDIGMRSWRYTSRQVSFGGGFQYSFYNYRLHDAIDDPAFLKAVTGLETPPSYSIEKQNFRSHSFAISVLARYYIPSINIYVSASAQGDFVFSKHYTLYYPRKGLEEFYSNHAFNPFVASAVAELGGKHFTLFVRYRLTSAFNLSVLPKDLPPLSLGIRLL